MNDKLEIAAYIRTLMPQVEEMQLQKLLYFSQGWALAWRGRGLFSGEFEAWVGGPVDGDVWRANQERRLPTVVTMDDDDRIVVDAVVGYYGHLSGREMSDLTHADGTPWSVIRADLPPKTGSQRRIGDSLIRTHFVRLSIAGGAQPGRRMQVVEVDHAVALDVAAQQAERWRGALDELAMR